MSNSKTAIPPTAMLCLMAISMSACANLSETECLDSATHVLVVADKDRGYQCSTARNECEKGFIQAVHSAEQCEANPKCEYTSARCYCPEGVQCICGGGPPAQCDLRGPE